MKVIREDFPPKFTIKERDYTVEKYGEEVKIKSNNSLAYSVYCGGNIIYLKTKEVPKLIKALQIILDSK